MGTRTGMRLGRWVMATAAVAGVMALVGCGLDEPTIPGFTGPATRALSLLITASPDVVKADGQSTVVVVATLRGTNGRGIGGREIVFLRQDSDRRDAAIGQLSADRVLTGSDGRARVVYTPPGSDAFQAHASVYVAARVVGEDAAGVYSYSSVRIELIPVDQRRFPEAENTVPVCGINHEPRFGYFYVGVPILFHSTSYDLDPGDYVIRHEWRFGDGGRANTPDAYHTYTIPGYYEPALTVMDTNGGYQSCDTPIIVVTAP